MPSELFHHNPLDGSISSRRDVWLIFINTLFYRSSYNFDANSVYPDQKLHSVVSDLGLHCLLMCILWDARHERVNNHILHSM